MRGTATRGGGMRTARALLAGLGVLSGCNQTDPYVRPGEWHPLGANAANLRAMVADPRDLEQGRDVAAAAGDMAAAAVGRLRTDTVKRLPASSVSGVQLTDTGAAAATGGGGPSAAGGGQGGGQGGGGGQ